MRRKNAEKVCVRIRRKISESPDKDTITDDEIKTHIQVCKECSDFYYAMNLYKKEFVKELDNELAGKNFIDRDDIAKAIALSGSVKVKKQRRLWAGGIAAAAILSIGVTTGVMVRNTMERNRVIAENTSAFVESLYDQPLFKGVEFSSAESTESFSDWLIQIGEGEDYF
ncbi:MAG: hypothetical protein GXP33_16705 [Spirochaetes bacterium]|nr:hypothetical protein [Spirochaetota bacterium]